MVLHHGFNYAALEIRPGKRARIEQYLANIIRELVAVPDPKMAELVPPQKQPLQMEGRQGMVHAGQPLRHAVIVGIFSSKRELKQAPRNRRRPASRRSSEAAVGAQRAQRSVAVGDQAGAILVVFED